MSGRDTIVAVSTGQGAAGVAVLRVSGPCARDILTSVGAKNLRPRYAALAMLRHPVSGQTLDHALTLYFPAPHSFTGEDVAEFHIHGGRAVQAAVLDAVLASTSDVRIAIAGEFTRRALENGKLDLAQVEGLAALIDSETEWQRQQALRLMSGELTRLADGWRAALINALAFLDAGLDFADEGDVADDALLGRVPMLIGPVVLQLRKLVAAAPSGERLRDGFRVAIIGPPNAGKSSLLNAIAKRDVAIVSQIAGTTRDVIEVRCDIGGIPVTFLDTAGLRASSDPIEIEGMERTRRAAEDADIILDLRAVDSQAERHGLNLPTQIAVATKIDLGPAPANMIGISVHDGRGLDQLLSFVRQGLVDRLAGEPVLVSERRQRAMLADALQYLDSASKRIAQAGSGTFAPELMAEDLRLACRALDQLIGRVNVDDVLDEIFGRFCIGK
jgi:tRNA modification GTPase